jgi:integrase
MTTNNPTNERIKRFYFAYLKEAKRNGEQSVDAAAKALNRFEVYTRFRDFKVFHREQAIAFKKHLADQRNGRTKDPLSKATLHSTLAALKTFFLWLAGQPGYKSRLTYSDADYFNISSKEMAVAKAVREQRVPTIEQIKHVLAAVPTGTDVERRNRAVIAFTLLTGARDSAIASLRLKHVDLDAGRVIQDAREVRTKFSKTFDTYFFPLGDDVRALVGEWVGYLRTEMLWGLDDPLFPATKVELGSAGHFEVSGLARRQWRNAASIRTIFRAAFVAAGLPYFNPHSFRKTLAQLGQDRCNTPEAFKAGSQNLGHDSVLTTFASYAQVPSQRQAEIIRKLARPR